MKPTLNHSPRGLRRPAFVLLAVVAVFAAAWPLASAAGQKQSSPQPNLQDFVGRWTATFKGKPFMTIHFAMKGEKLAGTMSSGEISLDPQGNIADVTVRPGERPIVIEKVEHDTLHVIAGEKDAELRCTFRLKDATHAQLEILVPPGSTAPKPIELVKQATKQ